MRAATPTRCPEDWSAGRSVSPAALDACAMLRGLVLERIDALGDVPESVRKVRGQMSKKARQDAGGQCDSMHDVRN